MKNLILIFLTFLLISCTSTRYIEVPIDRVKIEYRDKTLVDTFIKNDSVIIKDKGDTVYLEKYKYIYRTREVRDTVLKIDTVTVVLTVEVTKTINKIYNWQIVLMVLGGVATALGVYKITKLIR